MSPTKKARTIANPRDLLEHGLILAGFSEKSIHRIKPSTNVSRFKSWYGSDPVICLKIWEALKQSSNPEAKLDGTEYISDFLQALHFLRVYNPEEIRAGIFNQDEKTVRKWAWYFVKKIAALKNEFVSTKGCTTTCLFLLSRVFFLFFCCADCLAG